MTLQQKLKKVTDQNQETSVKGEDIRNANPPFGNKNAVRPIRVIELEWIHKTIKRTIQVRKNKGGETRKTEVSKLAVKAEIMKEAISLFFPNGTSPKGDRFF